MTEHEPFMTTHQMIKEIRQNVQTLTENFSSFEKDVITREEFNMWEEARKTTVRWSIGVILTVSGLMLTAVWIIIATRGGG